MQCHFDKFNLMQWVIDMIGIQYGLLIAAVILPVMVLVCHLHQLSIGETRDKIFKDGIKAVMQWDINNEYS